MQPVDNRIWQMEEKINIRVFHGVTSRPTVADDLEAASEQPEQESAPERLAKVVRHRPVVKPSIELLDTQLRERCLDLFDKFREDGKHERLDSFITEATRILEDKMKHLSKGPKDCFGPDLATHAFGGKSTLLRISDIPSEQEAAHLLYRGMFEFIRNPAHHHLMGELSPDRVLQLVGFIDYVLQLAEASEKPVKSDRR